MTRCCMYAVILLSSVVSKLELMSNQTWADNLGLKTARQLFSKTILGVIWNLFFLFTLVSISIRTVKYNCKSIKLYTIN